MLTGSSPIAAPTDQTPPSFARFDARAKAGEKLGIVFFGGSLTWGAQASDPQRTSYRALTERKLEETYPGAHFRFWDAAVGGTGSQLGAFRLERDVLARSPDLVFLEFTVNDGAHDAPDPDRLASYESLVRRLVQAGIPVVQVILAVKADMLPATAPARPLDDRHKEIAAACNLPVADAVALMRRHVADGRATAEELWPVFPDQTHPGDAGYALYAEAVWEAYEKAVANAIVCRVPEKMIHADTYMAVNRQRLSALSNLPSGWKVGQPHRLGVAFDFYMSRWLDDVTIASQSGDRAPAPLKLKIHATDILLLGEATQKGGSYTVRVDGGEPLSFDMKCRDGNMHHVRFAAQGLDPTGEHLLEITPRLEPGQEIRLESLCVAGGRATVVAANPPLSESAPADMRSDAPDPKP